ncbi:MAG: response regulator [Opitutales bacterium]|jgi:DNA-binding response OmpR family regulator
MYRSIPRLIVADADRFMRESMCMGLGAAFDYMQASGEESAVELFIARAADAVIVSASVAALDAPQLCARIRALPGGDSVPVYILGDEDDEALIRRSFESGATDFLLSPVHLGLLARRIQHDVRMAPKLARLGDGAGESLVDSDLFRLLPDAAMLCGRSGKIAMVNEAFERVFTGRSSVLGHDVSDLLAGVAPVSVAGEDTVLSELACQDRGRVPVRVRRLSIGRGPWGGCFVFFLTECSRGQLAAQVAQENVRSASVLVLEDYEVVSRSIRRLLEKAGHRVVVAVSADEVMRLFSTAIAQGEPFDLAILDLSIPGSAGGADVIRSMRALKPGTLAVVMSGAWNDPVMSSPREYGFDAALRKPFSRDELTEVINAVLAKRVD